jgi:hypothetical protein
MSRPRLVIGTFGEFTYQTTKTGLARARALSRDWDGTARQVQASAATRAGAERALKAKLGSRILCQPFDAELTADSSFAALGEYWLEDLRTEGRIAQRTLEDYGWVLRKVVLPVFGDLALREIGVARCDRFVKALAKNSYSRARAVRAQVTLERASVRMMDFVMLRLSHKSVR